MNKNWILILVLLLFLFFLVPSLREKIPISSRMIETNQEVDDSTPDLDFDKGIIGERKRYIESSSESFSSEECKQLLEEWQPNIHTLDFNSVNTGVRILDQAFIDISGGLRGITFIYKNDNTFEGCNVLDSYETDLDEKGLEIEEYFDCEKEECKDYKFEKGRFLYVYETSEKYNTLKYLLRKEGKVGVEQPSLKFQILYIAKDMTDFIRYRINQAQRGYGCGR